MKLPKDVAKALALVRYRATSALAFARIEAAAKDIQRRDRELVTQRDDLAKRVAAADGLPLPERVRLSTEIQEHELAVGLLTIERDAFLAQLDLFAASLPAKKTRLHLVKGSRK